MIVRWLCTFAFCMILILLVIIAQFQYWTGHIIMWVGLRIKYYIEAEYAHGLFFKVLNYQYWGTNQLADILYATERVIDEKEI